MCGFSERVWRYFAKMTLGLTVAFSSSVGLATGDEGGADAVIKDRYHVKIAQLRTQYLQALVRLEDKLTRERKIDDALSVRAELDRFRRGNAAPKEGQVKLPKLRELARIYTNETVRLMGQFDREMVTFRKRRGEAFVSTEG